MFDTEMIKSFNRTEIEIYQYLMNNKEKIQYFSIRKLAEQLHMSTSSIVRFCEKCGCEGYADFKEQFIAYVDQTHYSLPSTNLKQTLEYFQNIDVEQFSKKIEECAEIVRSYKHIIFLGIGTSGIMAKFGAWTFSSHGCFSIAITEPYYPVLSRITDNDLIIALSVRGETPFVIEYLEMFKKYGAKIISITNRPTSTVAKMSEWNMNYFIEEEQLENTIFDLSSQLPTMLVLESIARLL